MGNTSKSQLDLDVKNQFSAILMLDHLIAQQSKIHASLLEKDDKLLEPTLNLMQDRNLVEVNEEQIYTTSYKGQELYQTTLMQQLSYKTHFDIFAHVDLELGKFADPQSDFLEDVCWVDLRVAIAEFKGIDPYRLVFLAMLSYGEFYENPDWRFDLSMGTLFDELEDIVKEQLTEDDLGYEDEEGAVSGHDVLEDVILQGAELNQQRYEEYKKQAEAQRQLMLRQEQNRDANYQNREDERDDYPLYAYYDPYPSFGAYLASALFIESIWGHPYW